ncbi:response regulator FixJ [Paracoccus rhizosphaerae]|uniref:Response regulator FixJ n=1 Tax=Paracoccus rhizosphaerae TaxID=1133347 RepID=A0ABV6CIM4_9RHOB|nr:response regulator FixJ [Paracoccus rhizosphaerae]
MTSEAVVHVVDDDLAVRQSLAFLLASDGLPVRLYDSAGSFLEKAGMAASGCVVTDVRMPDMDGIELLRRLKDATSRLPVIVMTGHADVPMAVEAMRIGAFDFVEKPFDDEVLLRAIRAALLQRNGEREREAELDKLRELEDSLSSREREVMDGLLKGKANKVIAHELGLSARTVEIYRANVMTKMQAKSLSDLIRQALALRAENGTETNRQGG